MTTCHLDNTSVPVISWSLIQCYHVDTRGKPNEPNWLSRAAMCLILEYYFTFRKLRQGVIFAAGIS